MPLRDKMPTAVPARVSRSPPPVDGLRVRTGVRNCLERVLDLVQAAYARTRTRREAGDTRQHTQKR